MFKAFVTGTDANGLRNTVGHIGVKVSISSRFSLNVLFLLGLFDSFLCLFNDCCLPRLASYKKGLGGIETGFEYPYVLIVTS